MLGALFVQENADVSVKFKTRTKTNLRIKTRGRNKGRAKRRSQVGVTEKSRGRIRLIGRFGIDGKAGGETCFFVLLVEGFFEYVARVIARIHLLLLGFALDCLLHRSWHFNRQCHDVNICKSRLAMHGLASAFPAFGPFALVKSLRPRVHLLVGYDLSVCCSKFSHFCHQVCLLLGALVAAKCAGFAAAAKCAAAGVESARC